MILILLLLPISLLALIILAPFLIALAQIGLVAMFGIAVVGIAIWIAFDVISPALWQWIFEAACLGLGAFLWVSLVLACWLKLRDNIDLSERVPAMIGLALLSSPAWLAVLVEAVRLTHDLAGHPLPPIQW